LTESHISSLATRVRLSDITRLSAELAAARLESANRLAAMRAALSADADGEADPLQYLRDEIGDYPAPDGGRPDAPRPLPPLPAADAPSIPAARRVPGHAPCP
jgi:hypothetical protein